MARRNLSLYIDAQGRSVLLRSGFSWLAWLALPLWALHRRLWLAALVAMPLTYGFWSAVNALAARLPGDTAPGLAVIAICFVESWALGRLANRAHRAWLTHRGYVMTATELPHALVPAEPIAPAGSAP